MTNKKKYKGFTLVEMVVTLTVVTLFTSMVLVFTDLAKNTYIEMEESSEGQILSSTLSNAIADELRYATIIECNGAADAEGYAEFTYFSNSLGLGSNCSIVDTYGVASKSKIYIFNNDKVDKAGEGYYYDIVGSDSYIFNLEARVDARYNEDKQLFKVNIVIYDASKDPETIIIDVTFTVEPLNKDYN